MRRPRLAIRDATLTFAPPLRFVDQVERAVETVGDQLAVGREIELTAAFRAGVPDASSIRAACGSAVKVRPNGEVARSSRRWRNSIESLQLGLTAVVKSFHPRDPMTGERRAHTDMKIPPRRERIFEMLRRRGVTAGALAELSVEVGDQMPMLGRIDVGAAGEAEQVLGLDPMAVDVSVAMPRAVAVSVMVAAMMTAAVGVRLRPYARHARGGDGDFGRPSRGGVRDVHALAMSMPMLMRLAAFRRRLRLARRSDFHLLLAERLGAAAARRHGQRCCHQRHHTTSHHADLIML